jgi:hypothetical protein
MCKACNAHNYASKQACHKCSAGKDGVKWNAEDSKPDNFRSGDWMCPCSAHNYASKNSCHKCGMTKMVANMASQAGDNFRPGDWMCPCGAHNYATKMACHKCGTAKGIAIGMGFATPQMGGGAGASSMPSNFRQGDWLCSCGAHNYASKSSCHKCSMPKQQAQHQSAAPQHGGYGQQMGGQDMYGGYSMGGLGMGMGQHMGGMQQQGMGGYGMAPQQHQAYGGMPAAASSPNFRPGDWMCQCGAHNYASKTACHKCSTAKGENGAAPAQQQFGGGGGGGGTGGQPNNFRAGDWMCPCSAHNYASKTSCHKCGTPKN